MRFIIIIMFIVVIFIKFLPVARIYFKAFSQFVFIAFNLFLSSLIIIIIPSSHHGQFLIVVTHAYLADFSLINNSSRARLLQVFMKFMDSNVWIHPHPPHSLIPRCHHNQKLSFKLLSNFKVFSWEFNTFVLSTNLINFNL